MLKIAFILGITLLCLAVQNAVAQVLGTWFVPNLLLIAVVFFNLYRGLRYSLIAAFWGGFLLDAFAGTVGGINVFSMVMCAFFAGWLKKYIYQPGVDMSRVLMVMATTSINTLIQYFLMTARADIAFGEAFLTAILPEILWTTLAASYAFEYLKRCASRLFA